MSYKYKIDNYVLSERIGKGASGKVYLATDPYEVKVALKVF